MSFWRNYLQTNGVTIFSKTTCPYCDEVKNLFDSLDVKYKAIEVNQGWTDAQIMQLKQETGHNSFPNVWVGNTSLKGCSDVKKLLDNDSLFKILAQHGVAFTQ